MNGRAWKASRGAVISPRRLEQMYISTCGSSRYLQDFCGAVEGSERVRAGEFAR